MAHKHTHDHDHDHSHSHEHDSTESIEHLDAAGKSLSDALRISFVILKVIMTILVIAFLASGFKTVDPNEQALVLRFGKIVPAGNDGAVAVKPGPHWIFPYPIDEMIKIPVQEQIDLNIYTFWYQRSPTEIETGAPGPTERVNATLNPISDGYALTRSQDAPAGSVLPTSLTDSEASDYSIVHTQWQVVYRVSNIEEFFRNVYVEDLKPGQVYLKDVMRPSVEPLIQSIVEDAVVDVIARYTIDQAFQSMPSIPRNVHQLAQEKLNDINSGIELTSVRLTKATWPRQVRDAFQAFITASQESGRDRTEAQTYADNTLNEAAGRVAGKLFKAITSDTVDPNEVETLWSDAAGSARELISEARSYRTNTVSEAEASAKYLESVLPGYIERPELVAWQKYLDTLHDVLGAAEEKFVLPPSNRDEGQEIRILLNSDPTLKRAKKQTDDEATDDTATSR